MSSLPGRAIIENLMPMEEHVAESNFEKLRQALLGQINVYCQGEDLVVEAEPHRIALDNMGIDFSDEELSNCDWDERLNMLYDGLSQSLQAAEKATPMPGRPQGQYSQGKYRAVMENIAKIHSLDVNEVLYDVHASLAEHFALILLAAEEEKNRKETHDGFLGKLRPRRSDTPGR